MSTTVMSDLEARLRNAPVVPLIQSDDPAQAVQVMRALVDGGLSVIEVVLRTSRAFDVLRRLADTEIDALVGAGTVLSAEHAHRAVDAGARFLVSPGLEESVVAASREQDVPILPGIATASEAQRAWNLGLRCVKFFPASQAGGPKMLKALSSVFADLTFMPTGGVGPGNLGDYLAVDAVMACGGSWLTPKDAVSSGDLGVVTALAREAVALAGEARPTL